MGVARLATHPRLAWAITWPHFIGIRLRKVLCARRGERHALRPRSHPDALLARRRVPPNRPRPRGADAPPRPRPARPGGGGRASSIARPVAGSPRGAPARGERRDVHAAHTSKGLLRRALGGRPASPRARCGRIPRMRPPHASLARTSWREARESLGPVFARPHLWPPTRPPRVHGSACGNRRSSLGACLAHSPSNGSTSGRERERGVTLATRARTHDGLRCVILRSRSLPDELPLDGE